MRWYACPEGKGEKLALAPQLFSGEKSDHPEQIRLRESVNATVDLLDGFRIESPWALRLDVGLTTGDLLRNRDLDNYAYPLARRLQRDRPDLVSVWCTKERGADSFVRIEPAREKPAPPNEILMVRTTASWERHASKEQIRAALAGTPELPAGPVRLELAFVVGRSSNRNWVSLWKKTIDSLGALLGHDEPYHVWSPRDGRVTELGMHVSVDSHLGHDVVIGISATPI